MTGPEWLTGQWIVEKILLPLAGWLNPARWFKRQPAAGVPQETVRLHCERADWNFGTISGEQAMQCHSRWRITNITDGPVELWTVRPRVPRSPWKLLGPRPRVPIQHVLVRHPRRDIYGHLYPILARGTSEASFDFWIQPPIREIGQDLVLDVVLVDQFGNDHRVRRVPFRGPRPPRPATAPPPESLHSLSSALEKDVAAILKNELTRYAQSGRSSGGLGSIAVAGASRVPTEYHRLDVTEEQLIVLSPADGTIRSDNLQALLSRYEGLENDLERETMRQFLLARLSRQTEYAAVGYLILLFFHHLERMPECLDKAVLDLEGDSAYGFSDLLRLLDLLLRYEHHAFPLEVFDNLERILECSKEQSFRIRERIAAVRAARLRPAAAVSTPTPFTSHSKSVP